MSGRARGQRPGFASIVVGIMRLARGRADGLLHFGATREAFLVSLAPLVAFPVVGGMLMLLGDGGLNALSDLLATLCALLAPPVLSFEVARLWGREAAWLRYATAFNWCQWVPMFVSLLLLVLGLLAGLLFVLVGYGLWLQWFVARHGLGLSALRAAVMVLGVNFATVALVLGPRVLALALGGAELGAK
jgi:hypothetical protein